MAVLRILPPAAKYLKKLKDKKLKSLFQEAIDLILENPMIAEEKTGDLSATLPSSWAIVISSSDLGLKNM